MRSTQADGAVPAKRHSSGEPAAPAAPYAGAAAEQLALQQLLMANPAALLQAKAAGLGGMLPGGYAGFMGFPGYMGVDTLLSGQARAPPGASVIGEGASGPMSVEVALWPPFPYWYLTCRGQTGLAVGCLLQSSSPL